MKYEEWLHIRAEFALLFEELAVTDTLVFPRDFRQVFNRDYHDFLEPGIERPGLKRGSLVMILCMALEDILGHRCDYEAVYSPKCQEVVNAFKSPNRTTQRLAETVSLALTILADSDFHTRADHPKYGHLVSMLPWIREEIVLEHFRDLLPSAQN